MMKGKSESTELWKLLNLIEDFYRGGFHTEHVAVRVGGDGPSAVSYQERQESLTRAADSIACCKKCRLCQGRCQAVAGEGALDPQVMILGEAPGADEDKSGRPFVGKAGQYLNRWLKPIELDRDRDCYIANTVKCRPPGNRTPEPDEISACLPYLRMQVEIIRPKAILSVGAVSSQALVARTVGLAALRGKVHAYCGIPLVATYHPSAVLRDSTLRAPVWEDLKRLRALLNGQVP